MAVPWRWHQDLRMQEVSTTMAEQCYVLYIPMHQRMMCWITSLSSHRRKKMLSASDCKAEPWCINLILMKVKSSLLWPASASLNNKDCLNPCLIDHHRGSRRWGDVAGESEVTRRHAIPSILNENTSHFCAQGFAIDDVDAPATIGIPSPLDQGMGMYLVCWDNDP